MNKILILYVLCLLGVQAHAQQKTIKGTVADSTGYTLEKVSVFEKDVPGNGTVTDSKGRWSLPIRGKGIFIIQSVGYQPQQVDVNGKTSVAITLSVDNKELSDVVVIGYGKKKRITNTGAISAISGDEIRQTPTASLQNALVGRVTGFFSQQRSGQPGSDGAEIQIRGIASLSSTTAGPLVIVDDIEYSGSISEIDPDQVESISILKDASSTAVYGIKGANGVIIITTRRGRTGKPQVSFRSEAGGQAPTFFPKFLNSYQSGLLRNEAIRNDNPNAFTPAWTDQDLQLFKDHSDPYGHPDIDWVKTLLRPYSVQTTNTLNISGGTDKAKYFISGDYLWQNGMVKNFAKKDLNSNYYYKRYNFRSNLDIQASKTLSLSLDLSGNFSERNEPNILGRNNRNKILFEINDYVQLPPFAYAPYNPDGSYGANPSNGAYSNNVIGRFALGGFNRSFDNDVTGNIKAVQKLDVITKGLSAKVVVGYNAHSRFFRSQVRTNFPAFGYDQNTKIYTPFNPNVYEVEKLNLGYSNSTDRLVVYKKLTYQGALNYDRSFGDHHISALALFNQTADMNDVDVPFYFRGFAFRTSYDYGQKYLLELSAGYNGSSRFSTKSRYAWFPSISGGWNISKESFFQDAFPFIDLLKLRASYGLVGTDKIKDTYTYTYFQTYLQSGSYSIGDVSRTINGIVEGPLGTDVTWEKEKQPDFGVDIKMFKNRLSVTGDYFRRNRYDILTTRGSVSNILGVGVPPVNLGRVQNNGFEVEVGWNGSIKKLNYSVRGNVSVYKNKIIYQDEAQPAYPWLALTGHSVGSPIGYIFTGFYADSADITGSAKTQSTARPGDLKFADLNKDGKIDPTDKRVLPYSNYPNTVLGFTGTLEYKGINLSFTFQSALHFAMRRNLTGNYTVQRLDSWRPDNTHATFPRLSNAASISDEDSDFWFRRMDYLRLKTVQLGYTLPVKFVSKLSLNGIRVYASGYNLFTWMLKGKNIYDFDPEAPTSTEGGEYPVQKVVNFGLQITF